MPVSQTDMETAKDKASATSPLAAGLVTLSSLPKSRWHNLQNLDIIKVYCVHLIYTSLMSLYTFFPDLCSNVTSP